MIEHFEQSEKHLTRIAFYLSDAESFKTITIDNKAASTKLAFDEIVHTNMKPLFKRLDHHYSHLEKFCKHAMMKTQEQECKNHVEAQQKVVKDARTKFETDVGTFASSMQLFEESQFMDNSMDLNIMPIAGDFVWKHLIQPSQLIEHELNNNPAMLSKLQQSLVE